MKIEKVEIAKVPGVKHGDLPMPDNTEIPKGVLWNDIREDATSYGMFVHKHRVYVKRTIKGGKNNPDTDYFIPISNFSIKILQHMEDEERPMYLVSLHNVHGRKRTFDCLTDDMSTGANFRKLCLRYGNFDFQGMPADFDRLLGYLMDKMGEGRIVNELGWQKNHEGNGGWWAFCNAAVNGVVTEYDKYGCIEIGGESYYIPAGNSIYKNSAYKFEGSKLIALVQNDVTFEKWAALTYKVHREHSMMAICFALATVFSDHIFMHEQGFPIYFLYGEPSTGKGELVRTLMTLFGRPQPKITLTGKANTDKGKLRMLAEHINLMAFLDEYRNTLPDEMFEMLKGIWDRTGYKRGTITSRYGTESVPIRCTAAVTGNYYPNHDDALLTRLVVEEMEKTQFSKEEKKQYGKLQEMMLKGYSGIMVELLKHREAFEKEYLDCSKAVRTDVDTLLALRISQDRMLKNITILGAVYKFFEKRLEWPFTYRQLMDHMVACTIRQEDKRDMGNAVAHFWDCFLKAAKDGKLHGTFKIEGDVLSLRWKTVHLEYLQYHYQLYRLNGESSTGMLDKLRKSPSWLGEKASIWIGDKKTSAFQFKLSGIGEDISGLLVDQSKPIGATDGDQAPVKGAPRPEPEPEIF